MSTTATLLRDTLNRNIDVLVVVTDLTAHKGGEGAELHEFGHSLTGESTYLNSQMMARVLRAFEGPVLPALPDMPDYVFYEAESPYRPGWVYFVFDHSEFVQENERVASRNWYNSEGPEYLTGTAREVGCYTGFDVIGFHPDYDLEQVFDMRYSA
jgi:hypothetical protein